MSSSSSRLRRVSSSRSPPFRLNLRCCAIRSYHLQALFSLLFFSVVTPLIFFATQGGIRQSTEFDRFATDDDLNLAVRPGEVIALEQIQRMFPKEMIYTIVSKIDDTGPLSLNVDARQKRLSASWVLDDPDSVRNDSVTGLRAATVAADSSDVVERNGIGRQVNDNDTLLHRVLPGGNQFPIENSDAKTETGIEEKIEDGNVWTASPAQNAKLRMRVQRRLKRVRELTQKEGWAAERIEQVIAQRRRSRNMGRSDVFNKYSIWRKDNDENSETLVRLMRDQLIMARVYASIAESVRSNDNNGGGQQLRHSQLLRELRLRIKESRQALGEASIDSDLPQSASERIESMGRTLSSAREQLFDCSAVGKKLRAMLQMAEDQARSLKKQSTFLSQLAAKTLPKGIHCLSMRLTTEYYKLKEEERRFKGQEKLEDTSLYHYALFSDNVLAASVVVNSTVRNAKEPWKHVFHLVTDKLNYAAFRMWFLSNHPSGNAVIDVQNIDDFTWLNSSYCPVLRQLESAAMKEYYFKAAHPTTTTIAAESSNLKYRNPKYLSMLNHLRFYLPEIYPKLDKILFLDDDIVVQKDLTPLWSINLRGNVNGAVLTCGRSFHRFDKYLNFSNPHIRRNFDPHACGWAYGMNMFDLQQWKAQDITGIYHKWQDMNEDRVLWKLGTLPPGLITFYNLTYPLDKSWHVLGLGYNPSVDRGEIEVAAVVHYNGNMKPWLELGMARYKHYWTKYVHYGHDFLQQCNVN